MKKKRVISLLEDAKRYATLQTANFDDIGRTAPHVIPAKEVTKFIRERVELHHRTYIINYIERALELIKEGKP